MEKNVSEKIIIFFHIYYVDVIDEYLWYLNNIKNTKYTFDLYVSLCEEVKTDKVIQQLTNFDPKVIITLCQNRGADIGGFISSLRAHPIDFSIYSSVLYLHTKKSESYGKEVSLLWRGQLLNDTLINSDLIEHCITTIKNKTGIIGSNNCHIHTNSLFIYDTEVKHYNSLCNLLSLNHNDTCYFITGTIFWAHPSIFSYIQKSPIKEDNFKNTFAHFGLLEHGFERIFGTISNNLNLPVIGISLDIDNQIYHKYFKMNKNINSIHRRVFKISKIVTLPNETIIRNMLKIKYLRLSRK
jgi:lipopolysaccharide biosynthesis protein